MDIIEVTYIPATLTPWRSPRVLGVEKPDLHQVRIKAPKPNFAGGLIFFVTTLMLDEEAPVLVVEPISNILDIIIVEKSLSIQSFLVWTEDVVVIRQEV
ncbi:hypothetical protein TNCV_685361 [Trichonephila clavipes]|nr:hypothetical protein TNCV_685361 [Trichonephila clavipes]